MGMGEGKEGQISENAIVTPWCYTRVNRRTGKRFKFLIVFAVFAC